MHAKLLTELTKISCVTTDYLRPKIVLVFQNSENSIYKRKSAEQVVLQVKSKIYQIFIF
jgi:hypothetical protein